MKRPKDSKCPVCGRVCITVYSGTPEKCYKWYYICRKCVFSMEATDENRIPQDNKKCNRLHPDTGSNNDNSETLFKHAVRVPKIVDFEFPPNCSSHISPVSPNWNLTQYDVVFLKTMRIDPR